MPSMKCGCLIVIDLATKGMYSDDRLQTPMIKQNGVWQETDWETALEFVRDNLDKILSNHGGSQLGGLASPASTLEELIFVSEIITRACL